MRTITTTVYKFEELPEESQQKAIEKNYDFNIDHEWWQFTYTDAEDVDLKISAFDLDRRTIEMEFIGDEWDTADAIEKGHGTQSPTRETVKNFRAACDNDRLVNCQDDADTLAWSGEARDWDAILEPEEPDHGESCRDFLQALGEDYLSYLQSEFDYLTSAKAIKESLIANEYEFTIEGEMI